MSPWKVILATMVIFGCGVVTGALVVRTGLKRPAAPRVASAQPSARPGFPAQIQSTELLHRMDGKLGLTTNQYVQIEKIMLASQERTKPLWTNIDAGMQKELARVREEIHQVLTPDQQKKFADMLQSRPHRTEGTPPRDGDQFRSKTNRPRGNGLQTNGDSSGAPPSALPATLPTTMPAALPAILPGEKPPVLAPAMPLTNGV